MRPQRKLVQAQLVLLFADVDADGEIGETSQPVQVNISGKEWKEKWATAHNRRIFDNVVAQLDAPSNGAAPAPTKLPVKSKK